MNRWEKWFGRAVVGLVATLATAAWGAATQETSVSEALVVSHDTPPQGLEQVAPELVGMNAQRLARLDGVCQQAIDDAQLSGGVLLVARKGSIVYEKAFGWRASQPEQEKATVDTIFDMASLTKCVATASSVMVLVEQGKLRLNEPVEHLLPEWKPSKEETSRTAEARRLRTLLRSGGLRFSAGLIDGGEEGSAVPGATGTRETTGQLWRRLVGAGRVRFTDRALDDLISIEPNDRSQVTLRHLLTHTAGLDPFVRYYMRWPNGGARKMIIADIAKLPLRSAPGEKFVYSDLGFITLGEIVERVSGMSLNDFAKKNIYEPLGMKDTMFTPPAELRPRIAPTEWREVPAAGENGDTTRTKEMLRGIVHDGNAQAQDGISGHAGLFSTVHDLAIYCQMMLNGGEYKGVRIFSRATVDAMTHDEARLGGSSGGRGDGTERGYGWDVRSGYSGQRGDVFKSGWGHTGWTGTSIWVVPDEQLFIVLLTNRNHPKGGGDAGPLRAKVANVVAGAIED